MVLLMTPPAEDPLLALALGPEALDGGLNLLVFHVCQDTRSERSTNTASSRPFGPGIM